MSSNQAVPRFLQETATFATRKAARRQRDAERGIDTDMTVVAEYSKAFPGRFGRPGKVMQFQELRDQQGRLFRRNLSTGETVPMASASRASQNDPPSGPPLAPGMTVMGKNTGRVRIDPSEAVQPDSTTVPIDTPKGAYAVKRGNGYTLSQIEVSDG